MMLNDRRYFAMQVIREGEKKGKVELTFFYSDKARKEFCENKENRACAITMAEWRKIPKEMRA